MAVLAFVALPAVASRKVSDINWPMFWSGFIWH